ncbi:MAG TPA: hypothetical protein VGH58_03225 [Solirubrobacterales bacterium]
MVTLRACLLAACALLVLGSAESAVAAPGDWDRSFGHDGTAIVEGPSGPQLHTQAPAEMALGPGGEIFVLFANEAPCAGFDGCSIEWSVARFSADGVRDPAFGAGQGSTLTVRGNEYEPADLAVGPDGKPVVAALDQGRVIVARFDQSGHLEAMLGTADANPLFGDAYAPPVVAAQGDGKVVVAVGNSEELRMVRYLASGERDPDFGAGGEAAMALRTRSRPAGLLLGANGTISVAAPQCCGGSPPYGEGVGFARFLADGQPDPALMAGGQALISTPGARGNVEAAALAPDGGAYIAFEVSAETVSTVGNVVKLRPDGSVDTAFGKNGFSRFPISVDGLAIDGTGRLVAGGWSGEAAISRLRSGGGPDRTFDAGAPVQLKASGPAASVALQSKGRIVALTEPCCGTTKTFTLFRLVGGTDHSRCLGHEATIVGTGKADEITGTPHRDVIAALGGADKVRGLGGPDLICGGKGKDVLLGGAGRDQVKQ